MLILGIAAFLLFVLGDYNDAFFRKKALKPCFTVGAVMLCFATTAELKTDDVKIAWCVFAAVFLAFLAKSLFGSFSNSKAYTEAPQEREVSDTGLYALCRHPGVLFFAGLYICLHFGLKLPLCDSIIYILLNIILAFSEDKIFFPKFLNGYEKYKKAVPFLIPTRESIGNSLKKTDK